VTAEIAVTVKDVNDNRPLFDPIDATYACSIEEKKSAGEPCVTVVATDDDAPGTDNSKVTFKITGGDSFFTIDQDTGAVTTMELLDRELKDTYVLTVTASDAGAPVLQTPATIIVTVTDANDHVPSFAAKTYSTSVAENSAVVGLLTLTATDADLAGTPNSKFKFSLVGGGDGKFSVGEDDGILKTVGAANALDREAKSSYELTVQVQDLGFPPLSSTASVLVTVTDVNDNKPMVNSSNLSFQLPEDATLNTGGISITATDKDIGDNAVLRFDIVSGNTADAFAIDAKTGLISLAAKLDYETIKVYRLGITATDAGSLTGGIDLASTVVEVNIEVTQPAITLSLCSPPAFAPTEVAGLLPTSIMRCHLPSGIGSVDVSLSQ